MISRMVLALVVTITAALTVVACGTNSQFPTSGDAPSATSMPTDPPVLPSSANPEIVDSATEATNPVGLDDCVQTPSQTEGPYYFDTGKLRRDITEGLPGTPLLVSLRLVEAGSCEPVAGATIDIWHTDTSGVYSGYPDQGYDTTGESFLRGKQVTDANGIVQFETIYPGWYPTRAVHIHFMVYTDEEHLVTSQFYFPDAVSQAVYQTEPYAARGPHPVTNHDDGILPGDTVDNPLIGHVTENGEGYTISLSVAVTTGSSPPANKRFPVRRGGR